MARQDGAVSLAIGATLSIGGAETLDTLTNNGTVNIGVGALSTMKGFKKLNLDPKLVLKFVPQVLEWAQKNGGPQLKAILEKVLK